MKEPKPALDRLEQGLLAARLVAPDELERARQEASVNGRPLMRMLVEHGVLTEREKLKFLRDHCKLDVISLRDIAPRPEVSGFVSSEQCRRHRFVPLRMEGASRVLVAMEDPTNLEGRTLVETAFEKEVVPVIASGEDVDLAISRMPDLGGRKAAAPNSAIQGGFRVATLLMLTFLPLIAVFYLFVATSVLPQPDFFKELDFFGRTLLFLLGFLSWASVAYFATDLIFGRRASE
ncbi:MAG: hypothetical protein SF028_04985 [Candidatus Sumerlaeia bacterium]|nr:hypothetical protein [Candidatus Sumerlaeia bacterium]